VLAMLDVDGDVLDRRARSLAKAIGLDRCEIVRTQARVGGGALPLLELEGPAVSLRGDADPVSVAQALRAADPPVIGRIHEGRFLLDPRTLSEDELALVADAVRAAGRTL
jgi:L-seryl-tRNA(Ser) seleniumtransferase